MPMSETTVDDILALLSHPDPTMRWRGATAVINNPEPSDPRVWEPLLRLVHETEPYLAQAAMTALLLQGPATAAVFRAADPATQQAAIPLVVPGFDLPTREGNAAAEAALLAIGGRAVVDAIEARYRVDIVLVSDGAARVCVQCLGEAVAARVEDWLTDAEPRVRRLGVEALGQIFADWATYRLIDMLYDASDTVLWVVIAELGGRGAAGWAVVPLVGLARAEKRWQGLVADPQESWRDRRTWSFRYLVSTLASFHHPQADDALLWLWETMPDRRHTLAHALRAIGTPEALAALEQWHHEHGDQP